MSYNDKYYAEHKAEIARDRKQYRLDHLSQYKNFDRQRRIKDNASLKHRDWSQYDRHQQKKLDYNNNRLQPTLSARQRYYANRQSNPEKAENDRVGRESNYLLRKGVIIKTPCIICQSENILLYHYDYEDPTHVLCMCRKHAYETIKQRNRTKKLQEQFEK